MDAVEIGLVTIICVFVGLYWHTWRQYQQLCESHKGLHQRYDELVSDKLQLENQHRHLARTIAASLAAQQEMLKRSRQARWRLSWALRKARWGK